jgi:hypothetical protein
MTMVQILSPKKEAPAKGRSRKPAGERAAGEKAAPRAKKAPAAVAAKETETRE